MARKRFPLLDVLIGVPATPVRGNPALLTHGTVIELYRDKACTTPADALNLAGLTISSVTVQGVSIPEFDGPDDGIGLLYGRPAGVTGNGFPIFSQDVSGAIEADPASGLPVFVLPNGTRVPYLNADDQLPPEIVAGLVEALNAGGFSGTDNVFYDFEAGVMPDRPTASPNRHTRWWGPEGSHPNVGIPPAQNVMYRGDEGIVVPGTVVTPPPPPPPPPPPATGRFAGDPGQGKFYFGGRPDQISFSNRATAFSTWESRMLPWSGANGSTKTKITLDRIYDSTASVANGLNSDPKSSIAAAYTAGRLPWVSFKLPSGLTNTQARNQTGDFNLWMDNLAAYFLTLAPKPFWWTFHHEPENDAATWGAPTAESDLALGYRIVQRNIANALESRGVTNGAFFPVCYMTPFTFGDRSSGRDWRIYWPDWKGTTTPFANGVASGKNNPNPVDFRIKGDDPLAVADGMGLDVYNWWDEEGKPKSVYETFWDLFRFCYERTEFMGIPYAMGEFGVMVYHTGDWDTGTAANWDKPLALAHIAEMFDACETYDIVGIAVFNYAITRPHWRLELADPDQTRYQGYGTGMRRASHATPDLTP